jgi:hypothetical protein
MAGILKVSPFNVRRLWRRKKRSWRPKSGSRSLQSLFRQNSQSPEEDILILIASRQLYVDLTREIQGIRNNSAHPEARDEGTIHSASNADQANRAKHCSMRAPMAGLDRRQPEAHSSTNVEGRYEPVVAAKNTVNHERRHFRMRNDLSHRSKT